MFSDFILTAINIKPCIYHNTFIGMYKINRVSSETYVQCNTNLLILIVYFFFFIDT